MARVKPFIIDVSNLNRTKTNKYYDICLTDKKIKRHANFSFDREVISTSPFDDGKYNADTFVVTGEETLNSLRLFAIVYIFYQKFSYLLGYENTQLFSDFINKLEYELFLSNSIICTGSNFIEKLKDFLKRRYLDEYLILSDISSAINTRQAQNSSIRQEFHDMFVLLKHYYPIKIQIENLENLLTSM